MAGYQIETKLKAAEDNAWDVIRTHGLPMKLDGAGSTLATLDETQSFKNLPERDRHRVSDARNVLVSAREVRSRLERGDILGALNYMRYVEQDADLLDHARRGAKIKDAVSAGGVAKAAASRQAAQARIAKWRREARAVWQRRRDLSIRSVANQVANRTGDTAETIRKHISDLRP